MVGILIFKYESPENRARCFGETRIQKCKELYRQVPVVFVVPKLTPVATRILKVVEPAQEFAAALYGTSSAPPEVAQPVDNDPPQPGSKGTPLLVVPKTRQLVHYD